jgi:uncharacterized Zn-binding protein involved in type VI secretion
MPGPIVTAASAVTCTHAIPVTHVTSSVRVQVVGAPPILLSDTGTVAGCPFNVSGSPMPCTTVTWLVGSTRVMIEGRPAVVQSSSGLCIGPAGPQGTPLIMVTQPRVIAQ